MQGGLLPVGVITEPRHLDILPLVFTGPEGGWDALGKVPGGKVLSLPIEIFLLL